MFRWADDEEWLIQLYSICWTIQILGMYNNAYVKQLDTVYLPLGAGMYSPEQLLVQGPVMTVSVPTAMCIDQTAQLHTNPCFYDQGICCTTFLYQHNSNALPQRFVHQPKLFAHSMCHQLNTMHNQVVTISALCTITVSTACTLCTMWTPPAWHCG